MSKKSLIGWLFVIFLLCPVDTWAAESEAKQVVVMIVPDLSFNEASWFLEQDNSRIWERAAIGAMNVRPDGPYSYLNNMMTLSLGVRTVGVKGWNSYQLGESFQEMDVDHWMSQVGWRTAGGNLFHPYYPQLLKKNTAATVGLLGQILEDAGVERRVFGHSDTTAEQQRYGSLLIMNQHGEGEGSLLEAVRANPQAPSALEMNWPFLMEQLAEAGNRRQLSVIEWGDLHRLYEQKSFMDEQLFAYKHRQQLQRLSGFLQELNESGYAKEIWLLAPMMNEDAYQEKQQLAPVFYWGEKKGEMLTSATTKQSYLVSSLDVVPTLLDSFGLSSGEVPLVGEVIRQERSDGGDIFPAVDEMVLIYKSRANVLSTYISFLVIALLTAGAFSFITEGSKQMYRKLIRLLLLSMLWSPFWFLALARLTPFTGVWGFIILLIISSITCGYLVDKTRIPIFWTGLVTFLLLTFDVMLGSPFMQRSYLGYDPIIGARYYGMGNEFAGVYLIVALMVLMPLLAYARKWLALAAAGVLAILVILVLGKSTLGTNAGATLSAMITFAFLFYRLGQWRWSRGRFVVIALSVLAGGVLLLFILQLTGERTHIGSAFERLLQGDVRFIFDLIQRKLAMNFKLFKHSNWTQLLVTSYMLGAIVLWRKRRQLKRADMQLFMQAGVVASFSLLLFNDSGVVAAATSMFCVVSSYYFWLVKSAKEPEDGKDDRFL